MGFKAWRSLSVLVFTGAALIGCNNGPQKDNRIVSSPNNANPYANANGKSPGFNTAQQQFPMANKSATPFGQNTNATPPPFPGASSTPIGQTGGPVTTTGALPPTGNLPALPTNTTNPPMPTGFGSSGKSFTPSPAPQGPLFPANNQQGFGVDRNPPAPGTGALPPPGLPFPGNP